MDTPEYSISWKEYISREDGQFIFVNGAQSSPPDREIYSLLRPGERDYNLGIRLLETSGGKYGCEMLAPYHMSTFAEVIVFGMFIFIFFPFRIHPNHSNQDKVNWKDIHHLV